MIIVEEHDLKLISRLVFHEALNALGIRYVGLGTLCSGGSTHLLLSERFA